MGESEKKDAAVTKSGARNAEKHPVRLAAAVLLVVLSVLVFWRNPSWFYVTDAEGNRTLQTAYVFLTGGMILVSLICLVLPLRLHLPRRLGWIVSLAALFIWPVLDYCISEMAMNTGCKYLEIYRYSIAMNIFLYCVVEGLIGAMTLNLRTAVEGGSILAFVFSAVNIYLMEFRQIPLYITDLVDIRTAGDVAASYRLNLTKGIWLLILFLLTTCLVMHRIWPSKQKYIQKKRGLIRALLSIGALAVTLYTGYYLICTKKPAAHGVSISSFRPIKSYRKNGGLLTFVRSGKFLIVEKPEGYSTEAVEALDAVYTSDSADADTPTPNLIIIMNESFADLQDVGSFETNQEVLPFWNSLEENTVKGSLYVSVFGGHTANTEYEVLTGDSYALCPSGTPYVLYVKDGMENLTTGMKALGYQGNLAMHPAAKTNYNRESVYSDFDFDRFISIKDFEDPQKVRRYVSDEEDFNRIIEEYEAAKAQSDDPFYMFNVTIQNHGGYGADDRNLPQEIQITSEGVESQEKAERYLNLIHLTDQELEKLIGYFEEVEEPTVIVMFGDHQPGLSDAFYDSILETPQSEMSKKEQLSLYKTPFMIWANYDIEEEQDVTLSANYLQTKIKQVIGLPLTGYDKFLAQLQEKLPVFTAVGLLDAEGNYYSVSDEDCPYAEDIRQYEYLVYNHLFDTKNRAALFSPAA